MSPWMAQRAWRRGYELPCPRCGRMIRGFSSQWKAHERACIKKAAEKVVTLAEGKTPRELKLAIASSELTGNLALMNEVLNSDLIDRLTKEGKLVMQNGKFIKAAGKGGPCSHYAPGPGQEEKCPAKE